MRRTVAVPMRRTVAVPTPTVAAVLLMPVLAGRRRCCAEPCDASWPHLSEIDDWSRDTGTCRLGCHSRSRGLSRAHRQSLTGKASPGGEVTVGALCQSSLNRPEMAAGDSAPSARSRSGRGRKRIQATAESAGYFTPRRRLRRKGLESPSRWSGSQHSYSRASSAMVSPAV
jgi:hypothetical protein